MADEQQRARPFDELRLEKLECFEVEIVGRLVEHQDVRRSREQPREQQPVALAARQRLHRRSGALGREEKVAQVSVDMTRLAVDGDGVVPVADRVEDRPLGIELLALLIVVGDLNVRAAADRAAVRSELTEQEPAAGSSFPRHSVR